ncbi:MAG: glutaredoxin [Deltaproteobacteria bacterium]|nr:glutaredoxin [Deltaproteobacteria bacterium]
MSDTGSAAHFTIYTTPICPFCVSAKRLLTQRGYRFREISAADPEVRTEISSRSGMRTVPVIYLGDRLIGGYMELAELDQKGELAKLLASPAE